MADSGKVELSGVSETLLIPLYFRAMEARETAPMVRDERARELIKRIQYDFARFEKDGLARVFTMMRCREFDRYARAFLAAHPAGTVVEIGCGLDDRLNRVDNARVTWYDLDLPDVMSLRAELLGADGRGGAIACSALDPSWLAQVRVEPGERCLFLAEGVLPYLEESQVRNLVLMLRERFPRSELVFDALSPLMVWINRRKGATRDAAQLFHWALRGDKELEAWGEGLRLLERWDYFGRPEPRLGRAALIRLLPPLSRGARILRYRLGDEG